MTIARLPYNASAGAEIDWTTSTAANESEGGRSGRLSLRATPIRQFHLEIPPTAAAEVLAIYATHRRRWPVGVRHWGHYTFTNEPLAYTQDGSFTYAPLRRKIMPATGSRYRYQRILIPDESETNVTVKVNGSSLLHSAWSFDDFGIVKIPNALVTGSPPITASGVDLVAACFMDDSLTETVMVDGIKSLPDVQLREILEAELIDLMAQTDDSG